MVRRQVLIALAVVGVCELLAHLYVNVLATFVTSEESTLIQEAWLQQLFEKEPNVSVAEQQPPGRFAYAFVVSGCTERSSCLGYILNVLVAARVLRDHHSVADVVLQIQMTSSGGSEQLPTEHQAWLSRARVHLEYLPRRSPTPNFGVATLHKFRVLNMIQYDRVLFLDADILLLCHLDYMFHESYNPKGMLQEHVAVAGAKVSECVYVLLERNSWQVRFHDGTKRPMAVKNYLRICLASSLFPIITSQAPATASMFLVTPRRGEYERIVDLVRQHRARRSHHNNTTTSATRFDINLGWGHRITPPDRWEAWNAPRKSGGRQWNFYAASADQGLLYHWLRYLQLNYTQIHADRVETWQDVTASVHLYKNNNNTTTTVLIPVAGDKFLAKVAERPVRDLPACGDLRNSRGDARTSVAPWLDHYHFAGRKKPWNQPIRSQDIPAQAVAVSSSSGSSHWARELWLYQLGRANQTWGLQLPSVIQANRGNPLGYKSVDQDLLHPDTVLPTT